MQHGRRVKQQQARPIHGRQIGKRRVLLYAPSNKRLPGSVVGSTLKHGVLDSLGLVRPATRALVLPRLEEIFRSGIVPNKSFSLNGRTTARLIVIAGVN